MKKFKKALTLGLSLVLTAALAVAGTLAYLTWQDSDVNVMTTGGVKIQQNEQQRVEADGEFTSELEDFEQGKILMPVTYPDGRTADTVVIGDYTIELSDKEANYVDKIVSVTNTGKSDAFVRTLVAVPTGGKDWEPNPVSANDCWLHWNNPIGYNNYWTLNGTPAFVEVDGIGYYVWEFTHNEAVSAGETTFPSVRGFYMDKKVDNDENGFYMTYDNGTTKRIDDIKYGDTVDVLVLSQAVQTAGFESAGAALDEAFGDVNDVNAAKWFGGFVESSTVSTAAELQEALSADVKNIVVSLAENVSLDVSAWSDNQWSMGGASTENITIIGNGKTLTFNQKNSDWNNVDTNNGASLTIVDAAITNSGYNNGPWNRHDINFACDVVLTDVVTDKALAFKAGATLNNVTINDANTSDTYAIWIQPNGQTVNIDGLTIDMLDCTDGRGIKIDEQYLNGKQKLTTLNVKNATFKTEEKAAILVKNSAGAVINLENIDIYGVQADPINAVWVDEASADYANLVTVNGGNKIVEGSVKTATAATTADISTALNEGANIIVMSEGTYDIPSAIAGKTVTLVGTEGTVVDFTKAHNVGGASITFENIKFQGKNENVMNGYGIIHTTGDIVYKNCTFDGAVTNENNANVDYIDCTFTGTGYITSYAVPTIDFVGCTFDKADSRAVLIYSHGDNPVKATIKNCTFKAAAKAYTWAGDWTAAIEVDTTNIKTAGTTVTIESCTADDNYNGILRDKSAANAVKAVITVDGVAK